MLITEFLWRNTNKTVLRIPMQRRYSKLSVHRLPHLTLRTKLYQMRLKATLTYFSRLIGSVPLGRRSISHNFDPITDYSTYGRQIQEFREPLILPHEFATNRDILLHTPYGLLSTIKLPVSETHLHVYDHERIIQKYVEERR